MTPLKTALENKRDEMASKTNPVTNSFSDTKYQWPWAYKAGYNELLPLVIKLAEALEVYADQDQVIAEKALEELREWAGK